MVEVGLIAKFILALSNATVSASVLITGMLVFSGLGSLVSERYLDRARSRHADDLRRDRRAADRLRPVARPRARLDRHLPLRAARCCSASLLIFPPAFLMGFPMPTAMTSLARLGKDHMFLWAWGINGCFSVVGAALVPIIATVVRAERGADRRRRRLSAGDPGVLRGAAAAAARSSTVPAQAPTPA